MNLHDRLQGAKNKKGAAVLTTPAPFLNDQHH